VGTDHNTVAFAVATLRRWWERAGWTQYPNADRLLVSHEVIVELIAATKTHAGLEVRAELDPGPLSAGHQGRRSGASRGAAAPPRLAWERNYTVLPAAA
jgi:hypothetical protein